ncbi:hypothetical protein SAMN05444266_107400 [Chitinophaga jiangningensis]|uniref:Uncharacterized protein n=1 Tax=Chitinophaga jiangningensis TaxID=1419482 RepID=A0A1M7HVK8_9BACT|nr:hypothetical protein [Chitinophaga jiangningensis]SHM32601.1 hypothetical protein SAMN05444266_107400 [Chitinophaga jiangningensis]
MLPVLKSTIGKYKSTMPKSTKNILAVFHARLSDVPITFRERVCKECKWSVPTFYRKMRLKDKPDENGEINFALSNAEKEKIIAILFEVLQDTNRYFARNQKKKSSK